MKSIMAKRAKAVNLPKEVVKKSKKPLKNKKLAEETNIRLPSVKVSKASVELSPIKLRPRKKLNQVVEPSTIVVDANSDESEKENSVKLNISQEDVKPNVSNEAIEKALNVLEKLTKKAKETRNVLFDDDTPLIMQIDCVKVPNMVTRKLRLTLPHWLVTDTSDVCLFVADLKKGKRVDHEPTVQHYEDLLKEKGITTIKSIIPVRQVRVEYDQMELKRRLLTQYDFFLADARVSGHLSHLLGRTFFRKNQLPTPVKMDVKDLKKEITRALHKSVMKLHGTGSTYALHVGNGTHTEKQKCENIQSVLIQIAKEFPGGWENIRAVHLKTPLSLAIPIYITLKNRNDINRTFVKPLYSSGKAVKGELSTILDSRVRVHSDGRVYLKKRKTVEESNESDLPLKKSKKSNNKNKENDESVETVNDDVNITENGEANETENGDVSRDENNSTNSSVEDGSVGEESGEGDSGNDNSDEGDSAGDDSNEGDSGDDDSAEDDSVEDDSEEDDDSS